MMSPKECIEMLSAGVAKSEILVGDLEKALGEVTMELEAAQAELEKERAKCKALKPERKSWDRYFMDLAEVVATRGTCDRLHVGAVLVLDKRIVSTGYNGAPPGERHCDDAGHSLIDGHCSRAIHAEVNAIRFAYGVGGLPRDEVVTLYTTHSPCRKCVKIIREYPIRVIYSHKYGSTDIGEQLK